ncbi:uncharacterized protein ACOB8E_010951 isoform 1-T2 [Sarcophilus harrisii]
MAPSQAPPCADWRLTRAASSCCAGSQLPQGKALYCGLGLRACAEICAFTLGLRLSSEPNFSPRLCRSPPWPKNQPFLARLQIFFGQLFSLSAYVGNQKEVDSALAELSNCLVGLSGLVNALSWRQRGESVTAPGRSLLWDCEY